MIDTQTRTSIAAARSSTTEIAMLTYNDGAGSRVHASLPTTRAAKRNTASQPNPGQPANVVLEWSPALLPLIQAAIEQRADRAAALTPTRWCRGACW
jgi:hypothetical protein